MADYYGDDDYDYRGRRPNNRRNITDTRRSHHLLAPNGNQEGLYRTRSQGAGPQPVVNVYTDVIQDNYQRSESPMPPYPPSPRRRSRDRLGDDLLDDLADMALERRRSRSRGRSDVGFYERSNYYDWERRRKSEEERIRRDMELEGIEREKEKQRVIDEYKKKQRDDEDRAEEEEKRIREKIKQEEIDKKEKEKQQREDVERKQRDEKEKAEKEKKEKQEEIDEAMRDHYISRGYSRVQADRIIEQERLKRERHLSGPVPFGNALVPYPSFSGRQSGLRAPTLAKIKREHIAIETLTYYGIEWETDPKDKRYIIILQEMTEAETQALFDHTRSLRQKTLLLEPPKEKPKYAWVRKRDRSASGVRKAAILKYED